SSTLSVISVSTSWGDAPGLMTVTVIVGRSIFGKRSTPSVENEKIPTTVSAMIIIVAKTGRRTQISASFCITKKFQVSSFRFHVNVFVSLNDYVQRLTLFCISSHER